MSSWFSRTAAAYRAQAHALRRLRPTPLGLLVRVLLSVVSAWLSLLITIALAPGIEREPGTSVLLAVAVIGAADFLIRPLLLAAVLPIGFIAVFAVGFLYRAASFFFILPLLGFDLGGFGSAVVGAGIYALVSTIFGGLVGMTDDESYGQRVVNQVIKDQEKVPHSDVPGVVVIQVDGLAFPLLVAQVRSGTLSTLSRWIRSGSHRMMEYTADLPSQTSTGQAGLLHGNAAGIPAFRWYEKERRRMMVSNRPADAAEIEARLSDGNGLLANGGASIDNMFSGDATHVRMVMSKLNSNLDKAGRDRSMYYFLLNPYSIGRTIVRTARRDPEGAVPGLAAAAAGDRAADAPRPEVRRPAGHYQRRPPRPEPRPRRRADAARDAGDVLRLRGLRRHRPSHRAGAAGSPPVAGRDRPLHRSPGADGARLSATVPLRDRLRPWPEPGGDVPPAIRGRRSRTGFAPESARTSRARRPRRWRTRVASRPS